MKQDKNGVLLMKRKIAALIFCAVAVAMIGVYSLQGEKTLETTAGNSDIARTEMSKIQVAQMLCALCYSREDADALDMKLSYTDVEEGKWYIPYIKAVENMGLQCMADREEHYGIYDYITCGKMDEILKQLSIYIVKQKKTEEKSKDIYEACLKKMEIVPGENTDRKITAKQWLKGYMYINKTWFDKTVKKKKAYVFQGEQEDSAGTVYTSIGNKNTYGAMAKDYESQGMNIYFKGEEVVYMYPEESASITISDIHILSGKDKEIQCIAGDREYTFQCENPLEKEVSEVVGDLEIVGNTVTRVSVKEEVNKERDIRVLINSDGFSGVFHDSVTLQANCKMTIQYGDKTRRVKKGKKVHFNRKSREFNSGNIQISMEKKDGAITIASISRNGIHPKYHGKMELSLREQGITVVNTLGLETYLYAVIPSEMPTSYPAEALKVQAVCARSYACARLGGGVYEKFGADVDDSTSSQVYNNLPEDDASKKAVDETRGQVLMYDKKVVTTYYYSTSAGHTSSGDDIWGMDHARPYLDGRYMTAMGKEEPKVLAGLDLRKEKDFRKFINEKLCTTYDSDSPWYRWRVSISMEHLKNYLDLHLYDLYQSNEGQILTKTKGGKFVNAPVGTIGNIRNIEVTKRKTGGIATQIVLTGSEETIQVNTEYVIRAVLAPVNDTTKRQDKSVVKNMSLLPSAFFYVDIKDGKLVIRGGGFGHGVGMSQTGVAAMAQEKRTCEDILKYFYKGCEIQTIYQGPS